jgi:bifunctional non-homologous end joining protein LigD
LNTRACAASVGGRACPKPSQAAARSTPQSRPAATERPPGWIEPCLATTVDKVPAGGRWLHEIKWDGYRLMVRIDRGKVTIRTRRGHLSATCAAIAAIMT